MAGIDCKGMRSGAKKGEAASGLERAETEKETKRERACGNPAGIRHGRRKMEV